MGKKAVDIYKEKNPDLVFMDRSHANKGLVPQAVSEIKDFDENAKVVMASSSGNKGKFKEKLLKQEPLNLFKSLGSKRQITKIVNNFLRQGEQLC